MGNYTEWPSGVGLASQGTHSPRANRHDGGPSGARADTLARLFFVSRPDTDRLTHVCGPATQLHASIRNNTAYTPKGHAILASGAAAAATASKPANTAIAANPATTQLTKPMPLPKMMAVGDQRLD